MQHDPLDADILGHQRLSTTPPAPLLTPGQAVVASFVLVGVYVIARRLWRRVLLWRERSSRLATRRRHGIPDSDLRPFNVAYSDAMTRARDDEKKRLPVRPQPLPAHREAQLEQNLRHRAGMSPRPDLAGRAPAPAPGPNRAYDAQPRNTPSALPAQVYMEHYNPRHAGQFTHGPDPAPLARQRAYVNVENADGDGKKRALDEDEEEHEAKKTRMEGDTVMDGDDDASFEDAAPRRGSKREADDDDERSPSKASRGKRARRVSQEHHMDVDEDVLEELEDELAELPSAMRGKKRDRAEAGSTFGGDGEDSAGEHEDDATARRRRRKRRTVAKRKSEASYARAKHDRDAEADSDEQEHELTSSQERKSSLHKKSRRRHDGDDVSMDGSTASRRREIGDEWESNGVKYKIGLNNQRLRQALVKKARSKFVMPKDSQHPDRDANLEVYVESWLTEEEYEEAKKQHLLAWQDAPSVSTPEATEKLTVNTSVRHPTSTVAFPSGGHAATGKNLLWSAPASASSTPTISPATSHAPSVEPAPASASHRSYRDTYRHSIATSVGLPISPFGAGPGANAQVPTVRRIASTSQALSASVAPGAVRATSGSPGLGDSVGASMGMGTSASEPAVADMGSPRYRVYSKWEKQELEATAMLRMREANRRKEAQARAEREERERVEQEKARRLRVEKERQEEERAERERQEKERQAKERAEKERVQREAEAAKAKAAADSVPSITVTAPTLDNIGQPPAANAPASGVPGSGMFNLPKAPATTGGFFSSAKTDTSAPSGGGAFNGFGRPSASNDTNTASSSGGAAAAASKPATSSFANAAPLGANPEPRPKDAGGASNANGASSLLSRMAEGAQQPAQAKGPFSGFSAGPSPFGKQEQPNPFGKQEASSPFGKQEQPNPFGKQEQPNPFGKQEQPNPFGKQEASNPFGKQENSNPFSKQEASNPFGSNAINSSSHNASSSTTSSTTTTTPKFNFGFGKTTSNTSSFAPNPSLNFNPSSSSLNGALTDTQQKTTPAANFGFKTPTTPASASNANASSTPAGAPANAATSSSTDSSQPKFSFATSGSPFGSTSSAQNKEPVKSAFGGAGETASPFGAASTNNAFSGSAFGSSSNAENGAAKPAEAAKPMFSFATPGAPASASAAATTTPVSKPTFSFASQTPAAPSATTTTPVATPGASPFSFKFGASTTPAASPFGAAPPAAGSSGAATSSAFGSSAFGTVTQQK